MNCFESSKNQNHQSSRVRRHEALRLATCCGMAARAAIADWMLNVNVIKLQLWNGMIARTEKI